MHQIDLILTLTAGLAAALLFGFLALKLKLPPIAGYLVAGLLLGPYTPGFVADRGIADQLAEIGVILLMFGVGLHFHLKDLLAVRRLALAGAAVQIACATAAGALAARMFGWSWPAGVIFGISISVASTVVLTRVLSDNGDLQSRTGRIAIGWLVVEDIFTVFALVMLPALLAGGGGGPREIATSAAVSSLKITALGAVTLWGGGKVLPGVLGAAANTRSRELFTLTVLVIALGIAVGSAALFGVSMALGAFLAGMVVGQSDFSYRAASEALPMRDAFAVLFFVSVGMLFDPEHVLRLPWQVAATIGIILLVKPVAALFIVLALGYGARIGIRVGVALAQIGEFSFILASVGRDLKVLPEDATHSLVAASIATIAINPLLYRAIRPIERLLTKTVIGRWLEPRFALKDDGRADHVIDPAHHAVVVGYGPVGRTISRLLREQGIESTVIELNATTIQQIRKEGLRAVYGDAARPEVLKQAGIDSARFFIVSAPGSIESAEPIRVARELNPKVRVLARGGFIAHAEAFRAAGADEVFSGEAEVAMSMVETILQDLGSTPEQMDMERERARNALYGGRPA